ncbi:MAG: hypothetical protein K9M44_01860 [Candidatus Pacebacteria bacterium]|nr:hypothetical protein [Candidatus Paceibacterota bacterium]
MKQKQLFIIIGVLAVLFLASLSWAIVSSSTPEAKALAPEEAKKVAEEYINKNLMPEGSTVVIDGVVRENDLYKMDVNVGQGQVVKSYLTLDGSVFFPQGLVIEKEVAENNTPSTPQIPENIVKADKPEVELFVMSHCPFGTQMEKGMLPVVETLGDKIDFELKFVDYAMHGEKEIQEQLRQYCIQENTPDKLNDYLACFLGEGNSQACLEETSINQSQLNSCVEATDNEYNITSNFENKKNYRGSYPEFAIHKADNEKYGVSGSPTLVINGSQVSTARDSATLLATVCESFNEKPAECETELSSASPSSGFGYNQAAGGGAAAVCE